MPKPRWWSVVRSYYNKTGEAFAAERHYKGVPVAHALNAFADWLTLEGFDDEIRLEAYISYEHTQ